LDEAVLLAASYNRARRMNVLQVKKAELQAALEKVKPGLADRELIEQATSFAFMNGRVVTYNDEISISHPVQDLDVEGAIKAEALYSFLNRVKQDTITIDVDDNQLKITAGRSKAGLVLEQEVKLPVEEVGEIGTWHPVSEDFVNGLKMCHPCCTKDMSLGVLTCVYVNGQVMAGSDSYQIIKYQLDQEVALDPFLLPASSAQVLSKYRITEIASGQGWVHFKTEDDTVFSSRVFDGKYPDFETPFEFNGEEITFPEDTREALERAEVFSRPDLVVPDMPVVTIEITKSRVKISAQDESGWFKETLHVKHAGEPIKFTTNVEFLLALLSQSPSCVYGEGRVRFTGEKWTHLISTMVTEDDV
jgi:DNA polymerase III sliding clamp (beta) subunit (PCNA family)